MMMNVGETASRPRPTRGGASDGQGYYPNAADGEAGYSYAPHGHQQQSRYNTEDDAVITRRARHYHQDYRTYKDEYRERDRYPTGVAAVNRQMAPQSRSLPVPAPAPPHAVHQPRRPPLIRCSSERYPADQWDVEPDQRSRLRLMSDNPAARGHSLPHQARKEVPQPTSNAVLDRRKKTVRFDGEEEDPPAPDQSQPVSRVVFDDTGDDLEPGLERDWSQDSGSGSGTFKDSGFDSSSNFTSSEDSTRGVTLVIGGSPQPLSSKVRITTQPGSTRLVLHS
jgi:hypothetical protein